MKTYGFLFFLFGPVILLIALLDRLTGFVGVLVLVLWLFGFIGQCRIMFNKDA